MAGVEQLLAVERQTFVNGLAGRETTGRVDGLLAVDPVGAQLVGLDGVDHLVVPDREELRVACLLDHKRREVHDPVELAEHVRGVDHRQEFVGDLLLASEEAHRDHHDALLLLGGQLLEVGAILAVVPFVGVPGLAQGLLVLAVDRPGHHVAGKAQARLEGALRKVFDRRHLAPQQVETLKLEVIVQACPAMSTARRLESSD